MKSCGPAGGVSFGCGSPRAYKRRAVWPIFWPWPGNSRCRVEHQPRPRVDAQGEHAQGVAIEVGDYPYSDLGAILEHAGQRGEPPFVLLLDTLQDPQNLGTLLRTAEVVGVHGVLLPYRRTATVTPAVVSASSGASEHLLIAQTNLAQAHSGVEGR